MLDRSILRRAIGLVTVALGGFGLVVPLYMVPFENANGIRRLSTDRRLELLRPLMSELAESITDLVDRLDRSYSVVHDDVEVLAEYGIVQFRREGRSKQPFVPYERIEFDVTVEAPVTGGDTEAPA